MFNNSDQAKTKVPDDDLSPEEMLQLLQMQREILRSVALQCDEQDALDNLCRTAERMLPDSVASIMLYDENRTGLYVQAAPSVPEPGIQALNGLQPGPDAGSCGTAVFRDQPTFVTDTLNDPRWSSMTRFAMDFDIRACWSMPIHIGPEVVGSFALSSFETRQPNIFHRRLLDTGAYIAGIILERKRQSNQLWQLAHRDPLTGLPNRNTVCAHLQEAIDRARLDGNKVGVLFIDLDRFKNINDSLGHEAGDAVLKEAAKRIAGSVRKEDRLGRLGGDEFVLVLEDLGDYLDVQPVVGKIGNALRTPIALGDGKHVISSSIGISLYPDDGHDPQTLIQNADTAMYTVKSGGRDGHAYYERSQTEFIQARVNIEHDLRRAIEQKEFAVHYQPFIDSRSGEIVAAEALLRWHHPDKGMIPPMEFIPVAEERGLIHEIGCFVMETVCTQTRNWLESGLPAIKMNVNLSGHQLRPGCRNRLGEILERTGMVPEHLELELTETVFMDPNTLEAEELRQIQAMGVSIALDDFGTGHSSLCQLKNLPIDRIKIDRSFIRDITEDSDSLTLVRAIIAMAHGLGLGVVAEGVETCGQQDLLKQEGCDLLQGYLLGKPVIATELEARLRQQVVA